MEKPPLDKVIKKLEELDIRGWKCGNGRYGKEFTAEIGPLHIYVYKWEKHHEIAIRNYVGMLRIEYHSTEKGGLEEKKILELYDKLCKEYEEHDEKSFEAALEQIFSD